MNPESPAAETGDDCHRLIDIESLAALFKEIAKNGQPCPDPTLPPCSETSRQLQNFLHLELLAGHSREAQHGLLNAFEKALIKSYTDGIDHEKGPFEAMSHALRKTAINIGRQKASGWEAK